MAKLDGLRKQIDAIDEQILAMLEKRATVVEQVAEAKREAAHARVLRNGIEGLVRRLSSDAPADAQRQLAAFAFYTRTLDKHRKQDLSSACPDLASRMREERCF